LSNGCFDEANKARRQIVEFDLTECRTQQGGAENNLRFPGQYFLIEAGLHSMRLTLKGNNLRRP